MGKRIARKVRVKLGIFFELYLSNGRFGEGWIYLHSRNFPSLLGGFRRFGAKVTAMGGVTALIRVHVLRVNRAFRSKMPL